MPIHRRNIALTRGIGIFADGTPMPLGVSQNGAGGSRATWTEAEGEFAGTNESNALQFAHA